MATMVTSRPASSVAFVRSPHDPHPSGGGALTVVLDTAWTPMPGEAPDAIPIRNAVMTVVERDDLAEEALEQLDRWAIATGMADRLLIDGSAQWFRIRERCWWWLHERLFWLRVVEELVGPRGPDAYRVPEEETALLDAVRARAVSRGGRVDVEPGLPTGMPVNGPAAVSRTAAEAVRWLAGWPSRSLRRRSRQGRTSEVERRLGVLDDRIATLVREARPRVLVLSHAGIAQPIGTGGRTEPVDPILGPVVERLGEAGFDVDVVALGLDHRVDADWATIQADPRMVPSSLLRARWSGADDDAGADGDPVAAALEGVATVPLDVDGVDLGPLLVGEIGRAMRASLPTVRRQTRQVGRLLTELRPAAMLLTHEGIRSPWLVAARRAGVPSFAVQHGVIYPTHPGYRHERHPGLVLPDVTFTYGDFERQVLLEHGGYRPDEVVASGSPRLDLDRTSATGALGTDPALRRDLGVADGDRMLVVSTVNMPFVRRTYVVAMLTRALGGPLPGTHVVFKTHPGEEDEGPYRSLMEGLARSGGYAAAPMTVIRRIDLYRLLHAADAHLGLLSTVLTDAVAAGTPNLIFTAQAHSDLLGYVAAGVARPVRDVADVRDALDEPRAADPASRTAFLARHFTDGDASGRIVATIADRVAADGPRGRGLTC
jgi:hypothetical protein